MKKKELKQNKGFTLVETLVALAIFSSSIVALVVVTSSGVANTNFAKNKLSALYLAQEGIELARNIRDTNKADWAGFLTAVDYCFPDSNNFGCDISATDTTASLCLTGDGCPIADTIFSRLITVTPISGSNDEVKITAKVSWQQGGMPRSVEMGENLFNWISGTQIPSGPIPNEGGGALPAGGGVFLPRGALLQP